MVIKCQLIFVKETFTILLDEVLDSSFRCGLSISHFETNALLASSIAKQIFISSEDTKTYLNELLGRQSEDGSWREDHSFFYLPDAMVSTTSALLALLKSEHLSKDDMAVRKAANFIHQHISEALYLDDEKKTIAFEAILVDQLMRLNTLGLFLPLDRDTLEDLNLKKRQKITTKLDYLYSTKITLHSVLDAFTTQSELINWSKLAQFQEPNGSMGIYGSSTVAFLENISQDTVSYYKGLAYLRKVSSAPLGIPPFYPSDAFEVWWALYHLADSPLRRMVANLIRNAPHLLEAVPVDGISVTKSFSLPDVDTTAMKLTSLLLLGYEVNTNSLASFYIDNVFYCYQFERRVSSSANVHALMAVVQQLKSYRSKEFENKLARGLEYLLKQMQDTDHLVDKWHLSNLYVTCHAVELFIEFQRLPVIETIPRKMRCAVNQKTLEMIDYILSKRQLDGGWGEMGKSTVEETGYSIRALSKAHLANIMNIQALAKTAQIYLITQEPDYDIPLWIGKSLYKSRVITRAVQVSALAYLDRVIGTS